MTKTKGNILLCLCGEELKFTLVNGIPKPKKSRCPFCDMSFDDTEVIDQTADETMPTWVKDAIKTRDETLLSDTDKLYESRTRSQSP